MSSLCDSGPGFTPCRCSFSRDLYRIDRNISTKLSKLSPVNLHQEQPINYAITRARVAGIYCLIQYSLFLAPYQMISLDIQKCEN